MPAFVKNPRFIVGTIVLLWLAYVIEEAFHIQPVEFKLIPFTSKIEFNVSAIIVISAIFGSLATLVIQYLWRRRSKNGSSAQPASSKTVA